MAIAVGGIAHGMLAFVSTLSTEKPLIRALTAWL
jgi:hypothetical protein